MRHLMSLLLAMAVSTPLYAQSGAQAPPPVEELSLDGPRVGLTALSPGVHAALQEMGIDVKPVISQFGWQYERQFYSSGSGLTALNEWVLLLGGLEQGTAIPSLSWIVGLRTADGREFGIGPNVTPAGIALAVSGGITLRKGALNVPVNVAVVPTRIGTRVSVLTGFTMRHQGVHPSRAAVRPPYPPRPCVHGNWGSAQSTEGLVLEGVILYAAGWPVYPCR
ncbi:MAG TPA: hypothetical protein VH417_13660 [Vicinamibacterales bacterium]